MGFLKMIFFKDLFIFSGDVAIQCNLENSHTPRVSTGGNEAATFPALDTRGLHTLAELCLRRADYEFCTQTSKIDKRDNEVNKHESFREPYDKLHDPRFKRRVSDSFANVKRERLNFEAKESAEEKCEDLKERKKQAVKRGSNVSDDNGSTRLHKLEEELEKMLQ